jgi:predicted RNA binding protein YcfA (HicA-like mRNA interferase family)
MKKEKLLKKILENPKNVSFSDIIKLISAFGFIETRVSGSHHIYKHPEITEFINIQNVKGQAKPYQIKQFLSLVEKYNLKFKNL